MATYSALIICNRLDIQAESVEEAEEKYAIFFDRDKPCPCGKGDDCDCFDFDDSYCDHVWEGDI